MLSDKVNKWIDENQVIDILIDSKDTKGVPDLRHFYNIIYNPVAYDDFKEYKGLYIAKTILREELGFDKDSKPGDFDVIIIPFSLTKVYFERAAVYEIKVVRPTRSKPSRNANSLGITQVMGLVNDGFPLVSLIHICMPEPLLPNERLTLRMADKILDLDNPENNQGIFDQMHDVSYDWFSSASADNQMKRLISTDIPKFVGLGAHGLNFHSDGKRSFQSCSQDFWHFQNGYFNPHTKSDTIEKLKCHFESHNYRYVQKIIGK